MNVGVQIQDMPTRRRPEWITAEQRAEAIDACAGGMSLDSDRGLSVVVDGAVLRNLLGDNYRVPLPDWPGEAVREMRVIAQKAAESVLIQYRPAHDGEHRVRQAVAEAVVDAYCERLAPVERGAERYAPVAVLLGPRLRRLRTLPGTLIAEWPGGVTIWATRHRDAPDVLNVAQGLRWRGLALMHELWSAPEFADERFDAVALRCGEWSMAWHELSDASLREIVAFAIWRLSVPAGRTSHWLAQNFRSAFLSDLNFALAEARYRGILPTPDELRVAWDLACERGLAKPDDDRRLTLAEVWARFVPLLDAGSAESRP